MNSKALTKSFVPLICQKGQKLKKCVSEQVPKERPRDALGCAWQHTYLYPQINCLF